ncbi:MAG: FIST C-terminal domain-containing protein, partial [Leptospirales bacterium]|nr:FIST C-terminal domain-containing protein [Leptospirales bacterium]
GIVQCDPEFVETGFLELLHKELGMPLAGGTTVAAATNNAIGSLTFSMLVLTSDDVEFIVSHTTGLADDHAGAIERSLKTTLGNSPVPPRLALIFPPALDNLPSDYYVEAFENVCGKVPVFGAIPTDDNFPNFDYSLSIFNDKALSQEMSYVLLFGNITPRFFIAAVPVQANIADFDPVITLAADNIVYELDNMPVVKYLENLGLADKGEFKSGVGFFPLLVTHNTADNHTDNPRPFVRAMLAVEVDGSVVCSGKMPVGAQITFGSYNRSDVMSATIETAILATNEKNINAILVYSCMVRQHVMGIDSMKELRQIKNILPADVPFMASYAGGEFSPTGVDSENIAQNRFHNYSLIICLL